MTGFGKPLRLRCESCGKRVKAPGPSAIASRGYWWHRPCTKMWDAETVDFPSDGKLRPRTILTPERES